MIKNRKYKIWIIILAAVALFALFIFGFKAFVKKTFEALELNQFTILIILTISAVLLGFSFLSHFQGIKNLKTEKGGKNKKILLPQSNLIFRL